MSERSRPWPKFDTIEPEMVEIMRSKTVAERLAIAHGMWRFARNMIRNILRAEYPEWTEAEVNRETARRLSHGTV